MKTYKLIFLSIIGISICYACEDFLDTKNLYQKDLDSYYSTPSDIEEAMSGVYSSLYVNDVLSEEHVAASLMSDLMFAGGGPDDKSAKNVDSFQDPDEDTYKSLWVETYNGLNRANGIIEAVQTKNYSEYFKTEQESEDFKNQSLGEAYFMRGFFLFRAGRLFGGIPLILTTDTPREIPRSSLTETFAQAMSDMKKGIELMPSIKANTISTSRYGHANKWIAQAYLARTFLFYTGYMTNIENQPTDQIALPDGDIINKKTVIDYLEDCIDNSGYALLSDFRNLWPYSYVNKAARDFGSTSGPILPWAEEEGLNWAGQDGFNPTFGTGNTEVMFALRFSLGDWEVGGQKINNRFPLFFGIRDNSMVPFGTGWGWGPINKLFFNEWDDKDIRKKGSVIEMGKEDQGTQDYKPAGDQSTSLMNKKYSTLQFEGIRDGMQESTIKGLFFWLYKMEHGDPMQLWCAQDYYMLRFADIHLMHSELTETVTGINKIRERSGLNPIGSYSILALKKERMYEFAFEGIRWFDLVRWGDLDQSTNNKTNYFGREVSVTNTGVEGTYTVNYRSETKGLVPIPESEIRLSNGVYKQNPGWD